MKSRLATILISGLLELTSRGVSMEGAFFLPMLYNMFRLGTITSTAFSDINATASSQEFA